MPTVYDYDDTELEIDNDSPDDVTFVLDGLVIFN
jgi:hypothetical protein